MRIAVRYIRQCGKGCHTIGDAQWVRRCGIGYPPAVSLWRAGWPCRDENPRPGFSWDGELGRRVRVAYRGKGPRRFAAGGRGAGMAAVEFGRRASASRRLASVGVCRGWRPRIRHGNRTTTLVATRVGVGGLRPRHGTTGGTIRFRRFYPTRAGGTRREAEGVMPMCQQMIGMRWSGWSEWVGCCRRGRCR